MSSRRVNRRDFVNACAGAGATLGLLPFANITKTAQLVSLVPTQEGKNEAVLGNVSTYLGMFWHVKQGKETVCDLCPSLCDIQPGERGTCGVRENINGQYVTKIYARPCAIKGDPIEKGPFAHILPGTASLAIGFAGCNLDCKYCQSSSFAKARPEATKNYTLSAEGLVRQAIEKRWKSITFTYSEPMQAIEYLLDVGRLTRGTGVKVLVHTAAHFLPEPFEAMCRVIDGVNIDLKGFSEDFYKRVTGGSLAPVLDNISRVRKFPHLWLEITNLVVPGYNDRDADFLKMCQWIAANCGAQTPLHVSQFFPQYKFRNVPPTPKDTIHRLRKIAWNEVGMRYVYVGNMPGDPGASTYCPKCGIKVIHRGEYGNVRFNEFDQGTGLCTRCGYKLPGVWA